MFLHLLSTEEQKNFLELANILINEDGQLKDEELVLINTYRYETRLQEEYYPIENKKLEDILLGLEESNEKTKKMILIELVALSISDNEFAVSEKDLIDRIRENFNIDRDTVNSIIAWVEKMNSLNKEIEKILE